MLEIYIILELQTSSIFSLMISLNSHLSVFEVVKTLG